MKTKLGRMATLADELERGNMSIEEDRAAFLDLMVELRELAARLEQDFERIVAMSKLEVDYRKGRKR